MSHPRIPTALQLSRPASDTVLTYCDDATGERVALSTADLHLWAGRTANLLTHGCGLRPGARAALLLGPHWQTAGILLGAWSAGLAVEFMGESTAGLTRLNPGPCDVVFADAHRIGNWIDVVPDAPHRFVLGRPSDTDDHDYRDYATAVRPYDATFTPEHDMHDAATPDGTSYADWARLAKAVAESADLRPGDRVLVDASQHEHPLKWLLAPFSVGASVFLCAHLDPGGLDERMTTEAITRVL